MPHADFTVFRALTVFCQEVNDAVDRFGNTETAADRLIEPMRKLVADSSWLDGPWLRVDQRHYQQHRLFVDPGDRFSVISFVWGPGQVTPIHDHGVWGVVGTARGAERIEHFAASGGTIQSLSETTILHAGEVDVIKPSEGDIHRVSNLFDDRVSASIHVYGANIGKVARRAFSQDGQHRQFVSGYSAAPAALESRPVLRAATNRRLDDAR